MRRPILVIATLALLVVPSMAFAQDDDFLAALDASREPFCAAMAEEFGFDQSACEEYLEQERLRFMVMDMDVFSASESSSSAASDGQVSFSSRGGENTAPFELSGGDYYVDIKTTGDCYYSFHFEGDNAGFRPSLSQSSYLYDVEPGRYYWWVNTGPPPNCGWSLTMSPA